MDSEPKVSILVNCYNCQEYLEETIDSVYNQTYRNWEIIFINNCSTDKSKKIINNYDEKIKYYQTPKFMTLGEARTYGLKFCNSKYLAFLDTDDVWCETLLEDSLKILENTSNDAVMTYSNIEFINEKSEFDKVLFKNKMPSGKIFRNLLRSYFITIASVIVKRECVKTVGDNFNIEYEVLEDVELFTNISYLYEIKYIDKVLAKVRKHQKSLTSSKFKRFPIETEMYINDLRSRIDDFDLEYKDELEYLNITLQYQYALADWIEGNNKKAKARIRTIIRKRIKYTIVYLLMNLSYNFFEKVMKLFKIGNY